MAAVGVAMNHGTHPTGINFGMPRVGHENFAALFDARVSVFRVIHYRDIVPHYPLEAFGYRHPAGQLWEPREAFNGTLTTCSGQEDPLCADSVPPYQWKPSDHMTYLGVHNDNCAS